MTDAYLPAPVSPTSPVLVGLEDWIDKGRIPLEAALGLDEDTLVAIAAETVRLGRVAQVRRNFIGAALTAKRGEYRQGEWTPYIDTFAQRIGVKSAALGRWMKDAQDEYGLAPPPNANPSRRTAPPARIGATRAKRESLRPAAPIEATASASPRPAQGPPSPPIPPPSGDRLAAVPGLVLMSDSTDLARVVAADRTPWSALVGAVRTALAATAQKAEADADGCQHARLK